MDKDKATAGKNYSQDIFEIRSMMEKSSRFMALSGLSGVMAGVYALIAAYISYQIFYFSDEIIYESLTYREVSANVIKLFLVALSTLILAVGTGFLLSYRRARRNGQKMWDAAARRMLINFSIPLATGGIFVLIMFFKGAIGLLAPATLIFYGLALVNGSKYTYSDIRQLGLLEILLGLLSCYFIGYGLLFWTIGFGVLHIIYGGVMYFKYER
ncbi:hypothetical protein [Fulvivirga sediminis]|uniref:Uncharacterized protein n=1 Tax=Fulvivirga sediminis TaxID=2803949 RepID=A0A937JXI2_9BACT|nr:hypothetical protein [Fulvivirga sediminis]MBL3654654.1 hypothetical protein [Fulvivirga sediminis]